jgi:hypothetical protein
MDGDRRYKQRGYQESDRNDPYRSDRPKQQGPRPPLDITGPKLPRLIQSVVASRCYNCAVALPADTDFRGNCPKCGTALHCCKQCAHFEPSTRFQCLKPIPERIAAKDLANQCSLFSPRVTVARDGLPSGNGTNGTRPDASAQVTPRTATDARAAFNNLFKK